MKRAFVVDFDGTIARKDVGHSIIKNFAGKGWQEWEDMWIDNKITLPMLAEMQWNMIEKAPEEIVEYASGFGLNEGFDEFYSFLKDKDYRLIITSEGFDFYINPILKDSGYEDLEVFCSHLEYNEGWKFEYPYSSRGCGQCGNCKKEAVDRLKLEGYKVYYIGDGFSDRCACRSADVVFAKSTLARYCEDNRINYIKFDNFHEVLGSLEAVNE